jgi:glycosyltransferase involved in cell wall biosynthesis
VRILVLSNLYPPDVIGGYEVACEQLCETLADRGHEVAVLTTAGRTPIPPRPGVFRHLRLADIWNQYAVGPQPAVVKVGLDATSRLVDAFNVQQLLDTIRRVEPEVVLVSNVTGLGGLGLMAAIAHLGLPWVWHLADSVPSYICGLRGQVVPALARAFARDVRGTFVSVSARLALEIQELGVPLNGRLEVLPYWIRGTPPTEPRTDYMAGGVLRVVSAGRLTPYKGIDTLIESVALLRDAGAPPVEVDLYGTVADVDDTHYPALIQRLGLGDRVRLLGPLPHADLLRSYSRYDVFAFPTWDREPFGLGPVEAAAHGGCVPVIAQNCGLAEWLAHGVHCLKVEPGPGPLAEALRALADGAVDPAPIARRAAAALWRDFHMDAVVPRLEALLAEAAASPAARPPGDPAEAARMAVLAEKLVHQLIAEEFQAA